MVVVYSISMLIFYWPLSFAFAISALIGSSLGQGNIQQAKRVLYLSFACCYIVVLGLIMAIYIWTDMIVSNYSQNTEIKELAQSCLLAYSFAYGIDAIQVLM